ncbi:MAG: phosphate transport system substrate-binding protein [Planctomycetota bacterium]|jgi:phosphate transport system substrate-binding protein
MKPTLLLTALASLTVLGLTACGGSANRAGLIQNKGSDTLVNVAQAWAEEYAKVNPAVSVAVSGGGSGVGISAMINGTTDIANASRAMKDKEIDLAKGNGIDPKEHIVGFDALAVYVNKENPIESISLEQLADIYGEFGKTTKWSQLGITMPDEKSDEIIRVSRQNNSGTYAYFRNTVLGKSGNYKLGSLDLHGSKDVVENVEITVGAIGYSGLAYATDHVKLVPVIRDGGEPVAPSTASAVDGSYPIARPLFMYTAGEPKGEVKAYMDWILSPVGQKIIVAKGYAPVGTGTPAGTGN